MSMHAAGKLCQACKIMNIINEIVNVCRVDLSSTTARTLFVPYWISVVAGPVAFVCAILHIALGGRYPNVGKIMESIVS